jgi:D-serine deaminase-like pyridoxal phosphate-dependent protein
LAALHRAGVGAPVLVIDRARLDANVAAVKARLAGTGLATRVVVKSLPAQGLISAVADGLGTNRYMVFNTPMLAELGKAVPGADVLMGKPLTAVSAGQYMDANTLAPQWLIDTPERLKQYAALTVARGQRLRANLEIDIGLHRGGFPSPQALAEVLDLAATLPGVEVTGLMGYDPHVAKVPDRSRAFARAQKSYTAARDVLLAKLPGDPARFTLNTAGSPTYALHAHDTAANEVSIGSAFVKPTDFDLDTLADHVPAAFIATPVLKVESRVQVPSLERLSGVFALLDPAAAHAVFIHGGHWMAVPDYPAGLDYSKLYGRSSNQELLTARKEVSLKPDDFVFLRPTQSEAVLLQFGDLLVYDKGEIADRWPTFAVSA